MDFTKKQKRMTWLAIGSILGIVLGVYLYGLWGYREFNTLTRNAVAFDYDARLMSVDTLDNFYESLAETWVPEEVCAYVVAPFMVPLVVPKSVEIYGATPVPPEVCRKIGSPLFARVEEVTVISGDASTFIQNARPLPACESLVLNGTTGIGTDDVEAIGKKFPRLTYITFTEEVFEIGLLVAFQDIKSWNAILMEEVTIEDPRREGAIRKIEEALLVRPDADRAELARVFPKARFLEFEEFERTYFGSVE